MYGEYKKVVLLASAIDDPCSDSDIMTWYTDVFCRSFYSTIEENLRYEKDIIICCDQLLAEMASPDDDNRYVAKIYVSVNQVFKSIDDNVELIFIVMIADGFSEDIIIFETPPISMGKAITEYHDINHQIVAPIQEVLIKTAECMIKLSSAT